MTVMEDLIYEWIDTSHGVPLGYLDYRFIVRVALTSEGGTLGSFVLGTDVLGGPRWRDVTHDVHGISATRGGDVGDRPIAGELRFRLNNEHGEWSPTESSYYGPGTLVQIIVGNDIDDFPIFTGITQSWNEASAGLDAYRWIDVVAWEPMYLLGEVDDPALLSLTGDNDTLGQRVDRLLTQAEWQFGSIYNDDPDSPPLFQSSYFAQDVLTELYLTADSVDWQVVPSKRGLLGIRRRGTSWMPVGLRDIGTDVPIVTDSLITTNDDELILSSVSLSRVGGSVVTYTNPGVAGRYQRRTTKRTDLITKDPGSNGDLAAVAAGILGRSVQTFRPLSVELDAEHGDSVFEFLFRTDINGLVNVEDPAKRLRFTGYSVSKIEHRIEPMNEGGVHWTATVYFEAEDGAHWFITEGPGVWGSSKWGSAHWTS
jgi:hypothetical protein